MRLRLRQQHASLVSLLRIGIGAQSSRRRRVKVHTRVGGIEGLRGNGAGQKHLCSCNLPAIRRRAECVGLEGEKEARRVALTRHCARTTAESTGYPETTQRLQR
ncbi:uncharacterized protein Tco025E_05836 [Trypanosoma conorhini]|uniref:Uncharacterized protein n=1 Tax=Trypanosoma conorhini TaxID=83891 RepID=A0A422P9S6_9TRYP|nr:uncharacterized protein Tco025E_05836 [Trypanosoma conorhini]RNF14466.1 hypothetical protein Tco025E_05836 [Trypanosoma conorhini]